MSTSWSSYEPSESGNGRGNSMSMSGYTTKSSEETDGGWPDLKISSPHSQHSEGQSSRRCSLEPLYDAFVCPLTLQVMREPVTIENGQTFEKDAIQRWFQECKEKGRAPACPVTGIELKSTVLMPSLALQHAIEEWTSRSEVAQIENARIALASNSFDDDMLSVLLDLSDLCSKNELNKDRVRISGLIPLIVAQLKNKENLRCTSLVTLRVLATENNDNKEAIGETDAIRSCLKSLTGKSKKEKEDAISLLAELAKHLPLCDKIGAINGSILILVGLSSSESESVLVMEKAEETLDNLEASGQNIKQMAENGRLQPLLRQLLQGTEEQQVDLVTYLADLILSKEGKVDVAKVASRSLVRMVDGETVCGKEAALKCLAQLSTLSENGSVLVEAGVLQPIVRNLFSIGSTNQHPMKVKEISATILANVVNSDVDLISLPVALTSEEVIHSILHLISNTGPAIEGKLLQVLVGLASSTATIGDLVYSILSAGATSNVIQFLEAPQKEIRLNCLKLLHLVSPLMAHAMADGLRGAAGQLGVLVKLLEETNVISEEQVAAAGFLSNLPQSDVNLTHLLREENALPIIARRLNELSHGSLPVRGGRYSTDFKVGLATILRRFTCILDDEVVMGLAQEHNLTALFTDLLKFGEVEEIKRESALALENLSNSSKKLSLIPEEPVKRGHFLQSVIAGCLGKGKSSKSNLKLCSVHGGVCSAKKSFCLVEAQAVPFLGANLEHRNVGVVEACLGALATLLHHATADPEGGVDLLNKAGLIPAVLDIMKDHKTDLLWRQSVWMVDVFLSSPQVAQFLSLDPNIHTGLVEAYRNGNLSTRQAAEKALKQLNKIPNFSAYVR